MTSDTIDVPRPTPVPVRFAQVVVVLLLALKVYADIFTPPLGDEAYYWMWGQKLAWSYFDHPPLHAWLLRLMATIFGWNLFSLRILTWLTLGGTLAIFWTWSRRLRPDAPGVWFWPATAIYLASPLFFLMTTVAVHDHLLIFLCFASAHLFLVFAEKWEESGRGFGWLYAAAFVLGLDVLTKYNGVLVGVGVAVFFVVHKPLRPLWRSPHLYLAALLSVAVQAPVFWWNATEGFASYKFHLSERWGGNLLEFRPQFFIEYVVLMIVVVGPFLFPGFLAMIRRPLPTVFGTRVRALALSVMAVGVVAMGVLSLFIEVYFYWNIVAFVLAMPLVAGWIRRPWVVVAHVGLGLVLILTYLVHSSVAPLWGDWTYRSTFGWPETAAHIRALEKDHPVGFVAATRYTTAAQLGFAMHDPEVTTISPRHDQYDYWFDRAGHEGEDALIVTDRHLGLRGVEPYFKSLTPLESLDIRRYGRTVYTPQIYLGRGFHSSAAK